MLEGPTDIELLADQIEKMKSIIKNKSVIITESANILAQSGKYDDDRTVIAAKLKRIWRDISPSLINKILPAEYKRDYSASQKATPNTLFQEFMTRIRDVNLDMAQIAGNILRHAQSDIRYEKDLVNALTDTIHEIHADDLFEAYRRECVKIRNLAGLVDFVKVLQDDTVLLKQQTDWRTKIDLFMKYNIRRMALDQNLGAIAKKLHVSSKWISETVNLRNSEDDVMEFVKQLGECPKCHFELGDYFNRASIAVEAGNTVPKIT